VKPVVRSIVFDDDGATVEFAFPGDVRGDLVLNRVMRIPYGPEYGLELDGVLGALDELLAEVIQDFDQWRPAPPRVKADDDDDDD
jgi:hypothetical protein